MKINIFLLLILSSLLFSCNQGTNNPDTDSQEQTADTIVNEEPEKVKLVGDETLNKASHYYADKVGHSASAATLQKVDELLSSDMQDLRDKCDFVYYPFSGPDFFYPFTMFPNADTYFLFGLEKTGKPLTKIDPNSTKSYIAALRNYLNLSYFITSYLENDLSNDDIDGVVPVISMLMAKKGCEIISVKYKEITDDSKMIDVEGQSDLVEIKFFASDNPYKEKNLYFLSGNVENKHLGDNVLNYINSTMSQRNVVSFLKAAAYILQNNNFSKIRNSIIDNSFAIIEDDSGIPYKLLKDWNITIYGKYIHPIRDFSNNVFQADLDSLYRVSDPLPLNFRVGYDNPSNWMVARRK